MLEVSCLSVKLDNRSIIEKINFKAAKGENISIVGPNGAGKTTLLKAIAGLLEFTGKVEIEGRDLAVLNSRQKAAKICMVGQGLDISGEITVKNFLELSRYCYRKSWEKLDKADKEIIFESMDLTACSQFADREIGSLSGGERQRVLIAGAIAQNSPVILLDEPLTYLDPVQRDKITKLIDIIAKKGHLVVTVTHEINEAFAFSSRILVMSKGVIVFDGSSEELNRLNVLEEVFDTRFYKITNPVTKRPLMFPGVEN
jgi:iron complex transport system ATP-binding protein